MTRDDAPGRRFGDRVATTIAGVARSSTLFRRRNSALRHRVPPGVARLAQKGRSQLTSLRRFYVPVAHRSRYENVYHCCVHKTGSQWIISVLTDPLVYRYSGLTMFHTSRARRDNAHVSTADLRFDRPFPKRSIVAPLYIRYDRFASMPKPAEHRAFYVTRDPRELLVSWYHSARDNHVLNPAPDNPLVRAREVLRSVDVDDGLSYAVQYWTEQGRFAAMRTWAEQGSADPNVMMVQYETLRGDAANETFRELFDFLDIGMPDSVLEELIHNYSFERLSGRPAGSEIATDSHLRSASVDQWRGVLSDRVLGEFHDAAGDLPSVLGYA